MKGAELPPPPLGTNARALLESAKGSLGPDAAAIARMRATIGVQVGAPMTVSATVTAAKSSGAGHALAWKLGATLAVAALAIGIALHRGRSEARPGAVAHVEAEVALTPTPTVTATRTAMPTPAVTVTPTVTPTPTPTAAPTPAASAARPPVKHRADLAREVELIDRAMSALEAGDPKAALAAVHLHAQETAGSGQLAEDAAAIEIEALCASTAPVATKLTAFDTRWPHSAQRHRLTTACKQ